MTVPQERSQKKEIYTSDRETKMKALLIMNMKTQMKTNDYLFKLTHSNSEDISFTEKEILPVNYQEAYKT